MSYVNCAEDGCQEVWDDRLVAAPSDWRCTEHETLFDSKFADACYYEPGIIKKLRGPKGTAYVEVQGELRLYKDGESISRSEDLRRLFPQGGDIDDEHLATLGWHFENNRWWAVTRDGDPSGEDDEVCDSYESALEYAEELVGVR